MVESIQSPERVYTESRERDRKAFLAGARYMFTRFGNWYGRGHMFYKSYFELCISEGKEPVPVSMIAEELEYMADAYAHETDVI